VAKNWKGPRPVAIKLQKAIMFDLFPDSPAVIADFFITDQQHYEALYYPIRAGEITVEDLDRVLGDPEAITKLVNATPSNPHHGIVFGEGQPQPEMGSYDDDDGDLVDIPSPEGSVKGAYLSHKDLMLIISHARDAMDHGDLYRALELLEVFFEKAHYWLRNFGSDSILQKTMDAARSLAAQVRSKMSQTSLKGPLMGLHTQEEQIQAVDMAADSLARGIEAASARNLFGLASEVGYLRALADLAMAEGAQPVATIAQQNADALVSKFGQIYGEIG
jgi:hypothetical protein